MTAKKSKKAKAPTALAKPKTIKFINQSSPPVVLLPIVTASTSQLTAQVLEKRAAASRKFGIGYAIVAVLVLIASTVLWSVLSARVQLDNADQLISPYLFENASTVHGTLLPGAHSFLLKWPIFGLVHVLGTSSATYVAVTVGLVLSTVLALAVLLYRIERRPVVFGTLCLALASALIAVPAEPYAGGLLPVNMAMITTRNIEYVLFIVCLGLLARAKRLVSWRCGLAVIGLTVLIASDKLFLSLSLGGAVLGGFVAIFGRNRPLLRVFTRQLSATVVAGIATIGLLGALAGSRVAPHIVNQSAAGPYGFIGTVHELLLAVIYALLGILTNFGANPAAGTTILRNIPHQSFVTLMSLNGVSVLINGAILAAGLLAVGLAVRTTYVGRKDLARDISATDALALMLIFSTLAAVAAYIVTKHDFAVDARYLGIGVFAAFIALAAATRKMVWSVLGLAIVGLVLFAGVLSGAQIASQSATQQVAVAAPIARRNVLIAQVMVHHPVNTLVGEYWRVVPAKFRTGPADKLNILPLAACSQVRNTLTSTIWQHDLKKHSFAYLLTLDGSLTDYPHCSFAQVVAAYGSPNASTLIAGTLDKPKEVILFYDYGINQPTTNASTVDSIESTLPVSVKQITNAICIDPTTVNIVAHQDDDLLFMNPDIMRDIQAGKCVRTIYLTAGDSGSGRFYTLNREQGSEAAYSMMLGRREAWVQRTVKLADKQFVTVASPKDNPKVSLIFMHLPDGNLFGQGYAVTRHESLDHLNNFVIKRIHSVDNQSVYTSTRLTQALTTLLSIYQPSQVRLQSAYNDTVYPDHSDHRAAGRYGQAAMAAYAQQLPSGSAPISELFYIGYPVHGLVENVTGQDLADATKVFLAYAKYDGGVCQTQKQCDLTPTYNAYLRTQYQAPN
jgi:LmbE family N-acetylglucosaminyl deacetylase